jgi:nucleoside-diphosphate-sugar epimerase
VTTGRANTGPGNRGPGASRLPATRRWFANGPESGPRVLVIGASGFLGTHVHVRARAAGLDVVTAGRTALPDSRSHFLVDLTDDDPARLAVMLAGLEPDVVINCAGATGSDIGTLAAVNVTGTSALVRAMRMTGRSIRLVHLGSAAEYGPSEQGTTVDETTSPRPTSAYGATKLAATRLVELGRATGLDAVVLRIFNPVGPGAPDTILPGRVAAEFRRALTRGTTVRLGPLDAVRDFVDVRDIADAAIAAALAPALAGAVLNIASGSGVLARTLVTELAAISGYDGPVHEDSGGSPHSAGLSWQQADIGRAERDLGWRPHYQLRESLADLWEGRRAAGAA